MANLNESAVWETGVYQLETTDPVMGGPDGIDNLQGKQLANRTLWLKKQIDDAVSGALTVMYANRLKTARTIAMSGDGTWSVSFDGNGNVTAAMTLANTGVAAGSYTKVTIDAKGRVTAATSQTAADIPALDWSKITSGKPTTLAGYGITDASVANLTDTTITAPVAGHLLRWNGSKWVNVTLVAADIPALDWSKITSGKPTTLAGYGIADAQPADAELSAIAALSTNGLIARTAAGAAAARSVAAGAGIAVTNGDGAAGNPTVALSASGVTAGSYPKVTVDTYGRVTAGAALAAADIPALDWSKIGSGKPTTLAGYGITDASVANLTDTTITAPAAGHLLRWNGSKWVNVTLVAADIPVHDWSKITTGKPTTLAGYGITDAVQKANASATFSPAAGAWHRIATSAVGMGRNSGRFAIDWAVSGNHGSARLTASCHYGQPGSVSIQQLEYGAYGAGGIVEARVVYHTVESGNYAYLEVKFAAALSNVAVNVEGSDLLGWTLLAPNTAGSVPAGYSSYTHGFVAMSQIAAGTYRSVTVNQEGRVTAGTNPTTLAGYGISDAQPADAELSAIAALSTNGLIARTAAGAAAARSVAAGAGIAVTNGDGVAGNPTVALSASGAAAGSYPKVTVDTYGRVTGGAALSAADIPALDWSKISSGKPVTLAGYGITDAQALNANLTALAGLNSPGLYVSTGAGTAALRTLTAGAGVTVSNGDGVAGNPTVALSASGVTAGSYPKVTVDTYGRVTGGAALAAADIPALDWSKISSGKPVTLAGYGITDGATLSDLALPFEALPFPLIDTADNRVAVTAATVAGVGGTVSVPAGTLIALGQEVAAGQTARMRSFTTAAWTSANLDINSTYYLRAQVVTGALSFYVQKGTDSDAIPASHKGTAGGASGGGFDSTQIDMLVAKLVTGAAGSTPTVTALANKPRLEAAGYWSGASGSYTLPLNWARTPRAYVAGVADYDGAVKTDYTVVAEAIGQYTGGITITPTGGFSDRYTGRVLITSYNQSGGGTGYMNARVRWEA